MTRRDFLRASLCVSTSAWAGPAAPAQQILRGTVCTLNDRREVFVDGAVWIAGSQIAAVAASVKALPAEAQNLPAAITGVNIYPGFIDLHKHITYDICGPWFPGRRFRNRTEFFNDPGYKSTIENPCRLVAQYCDLLNDVCLYAEVKALAGGTTALQGAAIYDPVYTSRLVRNVEFENFDRDRVHQTIWDVTADSAPRLRRLMPGLDAWIYHLSEGVDEYAQERFADLKRWGLLSNKLVAIHCLGLDERQLGELAEAGATLVAAPLGNLRLYGRTADLRAARKAGLNICLSSEWAPSGSKNLLTDLKVADQINQQTLRGLFTDREIVEMVTVNPARAVGWKDKVGQVAPGFFADLLVLAQKSRDPYRNLMEATEEDVRLVLVDGRPVYGDAEVMKKAAPGAETLRPRRGSPKAVSLDRFQALARRLAETAAFEEATLGQSLNRLKVRRALHPAPPPVRQEYPYFLDIGDEPLEVAEVREFLKLVFPEGVVPFRLDPVFVADDEFFPRVIGDPELHKMGIDLRPYFQPLLS